MTSKKLKFVLHSVKKNSIRYANEQYRMSIYVMNKVLDEIADREEEGTLDEIFVTFSSS